MSDLVEKMKEARERALVEADSGLSHEDLIRVDIATVLRDMMADAQVRADRAVTVHLETYASENGIDLTQGEGQ